MLSGDNEEALFVYHRRADVIATDLHEEVVLLDPVSAEMYSLTAVGRLIWQALPGPPSELAERVVAAYQVEPAVALADTRTLLAELRIAGLVETGVHAV